MSAPTFYPITDFGPVMKGMVIGGLGIFHVFTAQFAIGGGLLLLYLQRLSMTSPDERTRRLAGSFVDGMFRVLVLISFVLGAVTGVAMWFTSIQVSARTIGLMVDEFHWVWATEWAFFCLEIVAGYGFYRYGARLTDRARLRLLALYALAAWFSLFWINGILSWQLTPGDWPETGSVWSGFFNPTFFPSLLYRTCAATVIASLAAMVVINLRTDLSRDDRHLLVTKCAHLLLPIVLMPLLGVWFLWAMPPQSRSYSMGASTPMTMFMLIGLGSTALVGGYALVGLVRQRLYVNGATATLLLVLAFGATGAGEFVREGSRKPWTVQRVLYANSIAPDEVAWFREHGYASSDPYPLADPGLYPNDLVRQGAVVFRQCSVCHTVRGANGLTHLAGSWQTDQKRENIARLQHLKTFMPPFSGTPEDLEALVQWIAWESEGRPATWTDRADPAVLARLGELLDEAGTAPGRAPMHERRDEDASERDPGDGGTGRTREGTP